VGLAGGGGLVALADMPAWIYVDGTNFTKLNNRLMSTCPQLNLYLLSYVITQGDKKLNATHSRLVKTNYSTIKIIPQLSTCTSQTD